MIKKIIKTQFKLEFDWYKYIIMLMPLFCIGVIPMVMFYGCLLPSIIGFHTVELYLQLPVKRKDIVRSQTLYYNINQIVYGALFGFDILICYLFYIAYGRVPGDYFEKWMLCANFAQLGILLLGMGLYNVLCMPYSSANFTRTRQILSVAAMLAIPSGVNVLAAHYAPQYFNGYDAQYLWVRLTTLAAGLTAFCALTYLGYRRKLKLFDHRETSC